MSSEQGRGQHRATGVRWHGRHLHATDPPALERRKKPCNASKGGTEATVRMGPRAQYIELSENQGSIKLQNLAVNLGSLVHQIFGPLFLLQTCPCPCLAIFSSLSAPDAQCPSGAGAGAAADGACPPSQTPVKAGWLMARVAWQPDKKTNSDTPLLLPLLPFVSDEHTPFPPSPCTVPWFGSVRLTQRWHL